MKARERRRALFTAAMGFALATGYPDPRSAAGAPIRDEVERPEEPNVKPTWVWVLLQLVPSPEIAAGAESARFGVRWQVTPLLYSFGIHRGLSPWRVLVSEPLVRQSGSVELFASPEIFTGSVAGTALLRAGVRSYFPVLSGGESLSVSLGTSYANLNGVGSVGYEIGAYVLYGTLGVALTYSPVSSPVQWITTFRFRYF